LTGVPRVTCVIIFLNGVAFLAEAIDSVLAQTFGDFELILVDDGSTDGSTELAMGYAARFADRVRYLDHDGHANLGMSASRNAGAAAGTGELIAFLDADDVWVETKLAEQVAVFDAHPEVDLAAGAAREWRSWEGGPDKIIRSGHRWNVPLSPGEATLALYPLGAAPAPAPSNLMVRRRLFEAVGGFEAAYRGPMQLYEDQAFLAKAYLAGGVYFADRLWLNYRVHDQSCMAVNLRAGNYDKVRRRFLRWLAAYLHRRKITDTRIWSALWRAEFKYRRPRIHAAARFAKRSAAWAWRIGKRRSALTSLAAR
jgi:glycosyltransferase involved in cell wall biosynthesis